MSTQRSRFGVDVVRGSPSSDTGELEETEAKESFIITAVVLSSSYSSIIRNTIANGGFVGAGNDNDSPARTSLGSAGSFARGSGRIACKDGRSPWSLTTPYDRIITTAATTAATTTVSSVTRPRAREETEHLRSTCLITLGNSRERSYASNCTPRRAPRTWSPSFGR
ncbi:uncharacterized protein LOC112460102 [Temnothorax curvispinosus]|uniref:Uncharacterized protein LOC112460102 n=1 Tax=Temnothorax curvispinosus TaxID=300111 RepID=A0A6J1QDK8_9HYME|nr:uncharacterized protein LOC112460102 [Temnothorax curvispinosus]